MRAGVVYYKDYPENRGIAQLVSLLRRLGIGIDLVAASVNKGRIRVADPEIDYFGINKRPGRIVSTIYKPHPFVNLWEKHLVRLCERRRWDFIFVRESLLANTCLAVGKRFAIPVFLDMRENRPDMLKSVMSGSPFRFLLPIYLTLLGYYEKRFLPEFNHIFTVSRELRDWTVETYDIPADRVDVLGNYPSSAILARAAKFSKTAWGERKRLSLVFSGNVDHTRGLQYILPAMGILAAKGVDVTMRVIGQGAYLARLKESARDMGIYDRIIFTDLVSPESLMATLSPYDAGVVTDRVNSHTNVTTPGKLFEYMAIGLPVLSSPRRSVIRIVKENRCGIIFQSHDPHDIAEGMMALIDPEARAGLGTAGMSAVAEKYSEDANLKVLELALGKYITGRGIKKL
ncbi:MAG: glycosyltransferase family 4 protein [Deltaproteobacteria bacterium]|nr:glycosyltransferase family 4 protein [Deltaproteobacteria bacterium]